jgi:Ca2+-binding RTX toxin-like protein
MGVEIMTKFLVKNTDTSGQANLVETLTAEHFGANFLVNQLPAGGDPVALANLMAAVQQMSLGGLRWPGGTVTETVFDFRHENATTMNGDLTIGQHQFFTAAGTLHAEVTLTLQTRSAFGADHMAATALADGTYGDRQVDPQYLADMKDYIERTIADAATNGTQIHTFEIGNEFWGGGEMTATEYGRVARAMLVTINEAIDEALPAGATRPEVAIQSLWAAGYMSPATTSAVYVHDGLVDNQFHAGWTKFMIRGQGVAYQQVLQIADEITGKAEGGANLAHLVDGMIDHFYPKTGLDGINGDAEGFIFKQLNTLEHRLGMAYGTLARNFTEWDPNRFVDSDNDGDNDVTAANRGMPQAAMMVNIMYEMTTHGATSADVWPLYFARANYTNMIGNTTCDVRIPGAAFGLMAESLIGTRPLFDFEQAIGGVEVEVHGFANANRLVLMTANETDVVAPATILNLNAVGDAAMQARLDKGTYFITTTGLNAVDATGAADAGIVNGNAHPVLTYTNGRMATGDTITLGNLAAWDLLRTEITFVGAGNDRVEGRGGNDTINGLAGNDTLIGGAGHDLLLGATGLDLLQGGCGNDILKGQGGVDQLFGDTGNDLLDGGDSNDLLNGGAGNDTLIGGLGADRFVFQNDFGKDEIKDFSTAQHDIIDLTGMTGADDVNTFADVKALMHMVGADLHIQFATGELVLDHVNAATLAAHDFLF